VICALTVRQLKPGTFEDFRSAFMRYANPDSLPEQWVRFDMVRNTENPDEVICFGFFDGDLDALRAATGQDGRRDRQQDAIAPFVRSVGADGLYEIAVEYAAPEPGGRPGRASGAAIRSRHVNSGQMKLAPPLADEERASAPTGSEAAPSRFTLGATTDFIVRDAFAPFLSRRISTPRLMSNR